MSRRNGPPLVPDVRSPQEQAVWRCPWLHGPVALLVAFGVSAARAEPPRHLPDVVVTARAWPEAAGNLPTSVAVWQPVTDAWGMAGGLPDLADETPGVHRTSDGFWAGDLSIRGMTGDRVVVTLDGARLVTANDLAARMALIDLSAVERVEVFKGPVSALYGSGSLGGIVNIVLPVPMYPVEPELSQRSRLGVLHNPDGWAAHHSATYGAPRHVVWAAITARDADTYRDGDGNRVRNTQFADQAVSLRLAHRWSDMADSDVLLQVHRGQDIGVPGSGSAPLPAAADVTYTDAHRVLVGVHHRQELPGPRWQRSRLNLYAQQIERKVRIDNFPDGPLDKITPVGRHDTVGGRWMNELEWGDHQVGLGVETWRRSLDSTRERHFRDGRVEFDRPLPKASEWSYGAFVEDRWTLSPALTLTVGARADGLRTENQATPQWDEDSGHDTNWNAHAGIRWNLSEAWAVRGVTAAGYRAPSIEERYQFLALGDGRVKLGNPDLDAERSGFVEAGLVWTHADGAVEISGFHNDLRNRVGEEEVDEQTLRNANIDRARIRGIEAEGRWRLSDAVGVQASLAYLRGDDRRADEPLPDIAPLTGSVGLGVRPAPAWAARVRYIFAARQHRVPEAMEETPGWGRLDASVAYALERGAFEHEFRIDVLNVTDTTYRDHLSTWRGSPHHEPGRSVQVAWQARF